MLHMRNVADDTDKVPYVAYKIIERIDLILDTHSAEYTRQGFIWML